MTGGLRTKGTIKAGTPEQPLITVVTVVFNGEKTLEQTILSVINQTYKNVEYIIIDGNSTDGTLDIIKKYEDKIDYWQSEPDKGIYDAMNKGIDLAKGEWIHFLGDDDCFVSKEVLKIVSNELDKTKHLIFSPVYYVDDIYKIEYLWTLDSLREFLKLGKKSFPIIPHQGVFAKTELMKKRRFDLSYKVSADSDFMLETILNSPELCRLIDVPTVFFSSGGTSSSDEARNKDWMNICHKYSLIYKRKNIKNLSVDLVKVLLKKLRIYDKFMCRFESWKVHSCDNENCRWCN